MINVNLSKWIHAGSGFRQTCLLSPCLLFLCLQLLSNSFNQKVDSMGVKICPNGLRISHMLYVDDIIIFYEVNTKAVKEVKGILLGFCGWMGQRINLGKNFILFEKYVKKRKKKSIEPIMCFKAVNEFNYLGVKVALRRLVAMDFHFIFEKALRLFNFWGSLLLLNRLSSHFLPFMVLSL